MNDNRPQFPLDADDALVYLEKVVIDKGPDYVYEPETCQYLANDDAVVDLLKRRVQPIPSCIVGQVMAYSGLLETDGGLEWAVRNQMADQMPTNLVTDEAAHVLRVAQKAQDGEMDAINGGFLVPRVSWGEALELARAARAELPQKQNQD